MSKTISVAKTDEEFLAKLDEAWENHKISMLMIRDILMYMVRSFFFFFFFFFLQVVLDFVLYFFFFLFSPYSLFLHRIVCMSFQLVDFRFPIYPPPPSSPPSPFIPS